MAKPNEFYEEDEKFSDFETSDFDVYGEDGVEEAINDDSISPEEEGFMQGYNEETSFNRKRRREED
ncbi:MAG: hypothetical protein ABIH25_03840 [Candidatus Woesearchaeota archaeon]